MIKKIALPLDLRTFCSNPFVIPEDPTQRFAPIHIYERVNVVWHQKHQERMPLHVFVVNPGRFENAFCSGLVTQVISAARLAADRYEIDGTESTGKMRRVIERFAKMYRHFRERCTLRRRGRVFE